MNEQDLAARLKFAVAAALEAGAITLKHFRTADLQVELKADSSPVTVADREAEQALRQRIFDAFPMDAILGEEFGEESGTSGFRWILDPIDGTKSFVHGVPLYGNLIGVEFEERSVIGVINIPALDECVYAAVGQGAWCKRGESPPQKAAVSTCSEMAQALFLTSQVDGYDRVDRGWSKLESLQAASRITRTWGDCYGYLMVATGRADFMVDPAMEVWDAAALQPVLEEAGGTFTNWSGEATIYGGNGVATNRHLLEQVLNITRG